MQRASRHAGPLRHLVRRLLKATANVADATVLETRKRLDRSFGKASGICTQEAKHAMRFVEGHACGTASVALVGGIALGWLLSRRGD